MQRGVGGAGGEAVGFGSRCELLGLMIQTLIELTEQYLSEFYRSNVVRRGKSQTPCVLPLIPASIFVVLKPQYETEFRRTILRAKIMDPLTLLALAAAAGFVFKKVSSQSKENKEFDRRELTYSKDIVARAVSSKRDYPYDLSDIEVLPEYKLVQKLVQQKFPLIFVTGGAGTGKSTFIRWLLSEFNGAVLLGAPTAMAALNIEGKTLHSLCQLPPAWIVAKDIKAAPRRREVKEAKLLIIDEISMVTANLLDGVSAFFVSIEASIALLVD